MNKKIIVIVMVSILVISAIGIYFVLNNKNKDDTNPDTAGKVIIDAVGRSVAVPDTLDNGIVTIGSSGPLRFLSCFDVYDLVIEVDDGDVTDNKNGRAYSYAYQYDKLTNYHPDSELETGTVEKIADLNPSLVIIQESVWTNFTENCKILAKKCTVVVINAQSMTTMADENYELSEYMKENFNILGTLLGKEDRAAEIISGIESILSDIRSLISISDKNVYVAGVTINGSNTLDTTFPNYMPLTLINGNNAYDENTSSIRVTINIENLASMDIDLMVIDPSSSDKMNEENSQLVLKYIYGLNNNNDQDDDVKLYVTIPIVWDSINYDCSLAGAYYLAYLLYGTLTHDEVVERINNIFTTFYGENGSSVFEDMSNFFSNKSSTNGQELPLLAEVSIIQDDGKYRLVAT